MKTAVLCLLIALASVLAMIPAALAGHDTEVVAVDAGPEVTAAVLTAPAPTPAAKLPDPIAHPAAAYEATRDAYTRVGGWFGVLVGLFMLLRAASARGFWGLAGLNTGYRAAIAAAALTTLGAAVDAGAGAGTWLAVLSTGLSGVALAIMPTPKPPAATP